MVNDIFEHQQQNKFISQNERSRERGAAGYSLERIEAKANIAAFGRQNARGQKAKSFPLNITWQRKERAKDKDPEAQVTENSGERQYAKKTVKSPSGKDRPPRFICKRLNCSHDRMCDSWHLLHGVYLKNQSTRPQRK